MYFEGKGERFLKSSGARQELGQGASPRTVSIVTVPWLSVIRTKVSVSKPAVHFPLHVALMLEGVGKKPSAALSVSYWRASLGSGLRYLFWVVKACVAVGACLAAAIPVLWLKEASGSCKSVTFHEHCIHRASSH